MLGNDMTQRIFARTNLLPTCYGEATEKLA